MTSVCLYLHVHQPAVLRNYTVFDIGRAQNYFDGAATKEKLRTVVEKCYIPTATKLLDTIDLHGERFKLSLGITGCLLESLNTHFPEVVRMFGQLIDTGCVELLGETYHHSIASLISPTEFAEQGRMHRAAMKGAFGRKPELFVNTCGLYSNKIAKEVKALGYKAAVTEGERGILTWRSPNYLYRSKSAGLKLLLRHPMLSDDVSLRFSSRAWKEWPLTADKYAHWLSRAEGECINLFIDYETFGNKQWAETGIFNFLAYFPKEVFKHSNLEFRLPGEVLRTHKPADVFDSPKNCCWLGNESATEAWLGNKMQKHAFKELRDLEKSVKAAKNPELLATWRKLLCSDYLYFMSTEDDQSLKRLTPYNTPYDAFMNLENIVVDFKRRLKS